MPDGLPSDGLVIVAKRDCPTCTLVEPVMRSLDRAGPLAVITQDDPSFPSGVGTVIDDHDLQRSFLLEVETVPTLIRFKGGREVERTVGWDRAEGTRLAGAARVGWVRRRGAAAPRRRGGGRRPAGVAAGLRFQERRARCP